MATFNKDLSPIDQARIILRNYDKFSAYVGEYVALTTIKEYADSLNGTPADEWCKLMYKQICRQLDSVTHGIDEERPTGK